MATEKKTKPVAKVAAKAEDVKAEVKAEVKAVEEAVEKKAAEVKKVVAKKAASKKPVAKKEVEVKKEAPKKAAVVKKETISIQFDGKSYSDTELIKIAKDVWVYDMGRKAAEFKTVEIYVKPEENKAYFVVNGTENGEFAI